MLNQDQSKTNLTLPLRSPQKLNWRQIIQCILAVGFAMGVTIAIIAARDTIEQYAFYGYPGLFLISALGNASLIIPVPSFLAAFAAGSVLNPYLAGIVAGCGAALGEMTGYLAGYGGRSVVPDNKTYQRLTALMKKRGAWIIFILAAIPNPAFDVGGILAGVLKMPWWKFLGAAAAGKSIRFVLLALSGAFILGG
jgi:membrane protein YqaA with SNARE-associated domain